MLAPASLTIVDFHTHWMTKAYFNVLEKRQAVPRIERVHGKITVPQRGFWNPLTPNFFDMNIRLHEMENSGVDLQVVSLTNPWVDFLDPKLSVEIAKQNNDELSQICHNHPNKFAALATLPYADTEAAVEELDRSVRELGLKGAVIGSNLDGKPIHSEKLWPIYERMAELGAPLFIHPTAPVVGQEVLAENLLIPTIGFPMDTSVAVLKMIYAGIFDKIPTLKIILAHSGGTLPFLAGRLDGAYLTLHGLKNLIRNPPSHYLKRMYYDAATYVSGARDQHFTLNCVRSFVDTEKIFFGSDYPFALGTPADGVKVIENSAMSENEKEKILGSNAVEFLGIRA